MEDAQLVGSIKHLRLAKRMQAQEHLEAARIARMFEEYEERLRTRGVGRGRGVMRECGRVSRSVEADSRGRGVAVMAGKDKTRRPTTPTPLGTRARTNTGQQAKESIYASLDPTTFPPPAPPSTQKDLDAPRGSPASARSAKKEARRPDKQDEGELDRPEQPVGHYATQPLLHRAVLHQDSEQLSLLLHTGMDVTELDELGRSALHTAADIGHVTCVEELIAAGADPDLRDDHQRKPIHYAIERGHQDVVTLLMPLSRGPRRIGNDRGGSLRARSVKEIIDHKSEEIAESIGALPKATMQEALRGRSRYPSWSRPATAAETARATRSRPNTAHGTTRPTTKATTTEPSKGVPEGRRGSQMQPEAAGVDARQDAIHKAAARWGADAPRHPELDVEEGILDAARNEMSIDGQMMANIIDEAPKILSEDDKEEILRWCDKYCLEHSNRVMPTVRMLDAVEAIGGGQDVTPEEREQQEEEDCEKAMAWIQYLQSCSRRLAKHDATIRGLEVHLDINRAGIKINETAFYTPCERLLQHIILVAEGMTDSQWEGESRTSSDRGSEVSATTLAVTLATQMMKITSTAALEIIRKATHEATIDEEGQTIISQHVMRKAELEHRIAAAD